MIRNKYCQFRTSIILLLTSSFSVSAAVQANSDPAKFRLGNQRLDPVEHSKAIIASPAGGLLNDSSVSYVRLAENSKGSFYENKSLDTLNKGSALSEEERKNMEKDKPTEEVKPEEDDAMNDKVKIEKR